MKPVNVLLCCVLSAIVGALLCYAVLRTPHADIERLETAAVSSPDDTASHPADASDSSQDGASVVGTAEDTASRPDVVATPADNTGPSTGDARTQAARRSSGAGPMPMSDENVRRVEEVITQLRLNDSDMDDLYTLLDHEGRDTWSDAAEAQLVAFLRTHGGGSDGLEVKPPRCSATVCEIVAIAQPGLGADAAHGNWQQLLRVMFGQDWFRNSFANQRMGMTSRDGSAIYVTNFMRAEPAP